MANLVLRLLFAVIAVAGRLQISAAHAQAAPSENAKANVKAAKAYVDAGLAAQSIGDYDIAITLYTKAYDLVQHPILLFNIAPVHRLAERDDKAAKYYREFLGTDLVGPEAQLARALLAETEGSGIEARQIEEEQAAEAARVAERAREVDEAKRGEAHVRSPSSMASARDGRVSRAS